jgi:carboxylesterase
MLPLLAITAVIVALGCRALVRAHFEREQLRRFSPGPSGVLPGAEAIELPRPGAPAVLLLHGGGDTPQTLRYLAEHLAARGYAVRAPLLPGHGRGLRAFAATSADEWLASARDAYDRLREEHDWVGVIGLSMGGALAVQVAAARPELPVLVLLAPYLAVPRYVAQAARTSWVWGLVVPYVPSTRGRSIHDPDEAPRSLAYGVFSARALRALHATVRRATAVLASVRAPTLVVQSREDNRIAVGDAERAFERLGAPEKRLIWVEGTGHVLTVDYGRERIFALVTEWLAAHRAAAATGASASA